MQNTSPDLAVGEYWDDLAYWKVRTLDKNQDKHRNDISKWVQASGGVTAFDFTTKGILQAVVKNELWRMKDSNGNPPGLIGISPGNDAIMHLVGHGLYAAYHNAQPRHQLLAPSLKHVDQEVFRS
ncbi:hypothetical protein POM88_029772 [Heracleum sosnowskyi]|uniref:Uncharacterized protein n=1 Tax=Heracleum sosnowskyi TaxID=360622 RepID=A0AAD8MI29_9APIA|nr:hypothetical protein POM88_029772 [Heracleum sosnowskyi]